VAKHSSDNTNPEEFRQQWNRIIGFIEEELVAAELGLIDKINERKKAVDAVDKAIKATNVLKSKIKDMKKNRNRGEEPKEN
jgi:flagellar biosynthesis regulator FlbT